MEIHRFSYIDKNHIDIVMDIRYVYKWTYTHLFSIFVDMTWKQWHPHSHGSKFHMLLKGSQTLWWNVWFWGWSRKNTEWAGNFMCQKVRKCSENNEDMSNGDRNQIERACTSQIYDNLSIKINNHSGEI